MTTKEEERELRAQLARLQQEHRDLDAAIAALQDSPGADVIQVQRLKKRKLQLRDRITFIEDQLTPDIIATGNPGCTLQIAATARDLGWQWPVVHPVELLDASIRGDDPRRIIEGTR